MGSKFKQCRKHHADNQGAQPDFIIQLFHAVIFFRAYVITDNRLTAKYNPYDKVDHHRKNLTFDTDDGDGDILSVFRKRTIRRQLHVAKNRHKHNCHLGNEGRKAQQRYLLKQMQARKNAFMELRFF